MIQNEAIRRTIEALQAEQAAALDDDRLEDWAALFTEDATYRIVPRENHVRGLPITLLSLDNKDMIIDRVVSLREANIFNIHSDRHILGPVRLLGRDGQDWLAETPYSHFQTDQEGRSFLFSVGVYRDTVAVMDGAALFRSKLVISDTAAIRSLLSTPI